MQTHNEVFIVVKIVHNAESLHAHTRHGVGPHLIGRSDQREDRIIVHADLHAVFKHHLIVLNGARIRHR